MNPESLSLVPLTLTDRPSVGSGTSGGNDTIEPLGEGAISTSLPAEVLLESDNKLPGLLLSALTTPSRSRDAGCCTGMHSGLGLRSLLVVGRRCGRGGGKSGPLPPTL